MRKAEQIKCSCLHSSAWLCQGKRRRTGLLGSALQKTMLSEPSTLATGVCTTCCHEERQDLTFLQLRSSDSHMSGSWS